MREIYARTVRIEKPMAAVACGILINVIATGDIELKCRPVRKVI